MGLFKLAKQAQDFSEYAAKAAGAIDALKSGDENQNNIPDGVEIFGFIKSGFSHLGEAKHQFEQAASLAGDNLQNVLEVLGLNLPDEMKVAEAPAEVKADEIA